ncbi:MAG: XRE family transcriptional regulator [Deltaproteobacteria bacterium]|nr:MAG: XRE family transcriptional regulator [Deltaproteobacteria bacterium]
MSQGPVDGPGAVRRLQPPHPGTDGQHDERAYMVDLGHRLRRLREERGLTQEHLARRARIATDMISRLENGRYTSPGLRTLLRVARGLGVSLVQILPDYADRPAPGARARVRLATLVAQASAEDVELIAELATVILSRRAQD